MREQFNMFLVTFLQSIERSLAVKLVLVYWPMTNSSLKDIASVHGRKNLGQYGLSFSLVLATAL
jgi:hypothetical protein